MSAKPINFLREKIARMVDEQVHLQETLHATPPSKVEAHLARMDELSRELSAAATQLEKQEAAETARAGLPRVDLEPFEKCAAILVPMPPIYLALCYVHRRRCLHFSIRPDGYALLTLFIDRDGLDDQQLMAWCTERQVELMAEARRLAATPVIFN